MAYVASIAMKDYDGVGRAHEGRGLLDEDHVDAHFVPRLDEDVFIWQAQRAWGLHIDTGVGWLVGVIQQHILCIVQQTWQPAAIICTHHALI